MKWLNSMGKKEAVTSARQPRQILVLACLCGLLAPNGILPCLHAQELLLPRGSIWSFWDKGTMPGTNWMELGFDDANWGSGRSELGYGDNDEATVVSFGTNANSKYVTTYFRHVFTVNRLDHFTNVTLNLLRDDSAVVYVNGVEVVRDNLPGGTITHDTLALSATGGIDEDRFRLFPLDPSQFKLGSNIVAAEVHQHSRSSSDISFDLVLQGVWHPVKTTLLSPLTNISHTSLSGELSFSVANALATNVTVVFYGRESGPPPGRDFTVIALPDTQYYVSLKNGGLPSMFYDQTEWILENQANRNIAFVTMLGDCVENGDNGGNDIEWLYATNALYRLHDDRRTPGLFGIPMGVAVGNHDQSPFGNPQGTTTFYNRYFGIRHFEGFPYYGGHHGDDNDSHFELFSAGGLDFIVIHLEYDPAASPEVLSWANQLLETHADRRAILVSHYLIKKGTPGAWGPQGEAIYKSMKHQPNLFLMLCGHTPGEGRRADTFEGRTIHTLLADYQALNNGGNGYLRILEFSPSNHVIRVRTYSPTIDTFDTDSFSQFDIEYDMRPGDPFAPIQPPMVFSTHTPISLVWSNLAPDTTYEWRALISDGRRDALSDIYTFQTEAVPGQEDPTTVSISAKSTELSERHPQGCPVTINRTGPTTNALQVHLAISGSAQANSDYQPFNSAVVIPNGSTDVTFHIVPMEDAETEGDEEIVLQLVDSPGYNLDPTSRLTLIVADDQTDSDSDGQSDAAEAIAATDRHDAGSFLQIKSVTALDDAVEISWSSVTGMVYRILYRPALRTNDPAWSPLGPNIMARGPLTRWIDLQGVTPGRRYYRIRVVEP